MSGVTATSATSLQDSPNSSKDSRRSQGFRALETPPYPATAHNHAHAQHLHDTTRYTGMFEDPTSLHVQLRPRGCSKKSSEMASCGSSCLEADRLKSTPRTRTRTRDLGPMQWGRYSFPFVHAALEMNVSIGIRTGVVQDPVDLHNLLFEDRETASNLRLASHPEPCKAPKPAKPISEPIDDKARGPTASETSTCPL